MKNLQIYKQTKMGMNFGRRQSKTGCLKINVKHLKDKRRDVWDGEGNYPLAVGFFKNSFLNLGTVPTSNIFLNKFL